MVINKGNYMKKILLSIGTIVAAITPITVAVSCGKKNATRSLSTDDAKNINDSLITTGGIFEGANLNKSLLHYSRDYTNSTITMTFEFNADWTISWSTANPKPVIKKGRVNLVIKDFTDKAKNSLEIKADGSTTLYASVNHADITATMQSNIDTIVAAVDHNENVKRDC